MKARAVFREAGRDFSTGTSRVLLYFLVYFVILGLLTAHELSSVTSLISAADRYQQAGGNTRIIAASGRIDGAACVRLGSSYGVKSAAVRVLPGQLRATTMSTVPLAQYAATPGIADVLGARGLGGGQITRAGTIVGEPVLEQFGANASVLATNLGEIAIAGAFPYPDDGRRGGLGFAAVFPEPVSSTPYDECWVRAWPELPGTNALLNSVVLPPARADTSPPELTQLNTTLGRSFDGTAMFDQRMSRFNPILALIGGGIVGLFSVRSRRLELASARHAGVTSRELLALQFLQQSIWVLLAGALALAGTGILASYFPDDAENLWWIAARVIGLGSLGAVAGTMVAVLTIRERALFAYFKQRE